MSFGQTRSSLLANEYDGPTEQVLAELDTNEDGRLSQAELDAAREKITTAERHLLDDLVYRGIIAADEAAVLPHMFHKYDDDGNGVIDPAEIAILLVKEKLIKAAPGEEVDAAAIHRVMTVCDTNKDGMLEFDGT